jgi:DNA polymerase
MPNPEPLLEHVRADGLVHAFNSMFEWLFWDRVCMRLYGWPALPLGNTRDTMAAVRAYGLPGGLANAANAMDMGQKKDPVGMGLIRRFCIPHSPTKKDPGLRLYMGNDHENALRFYDYCAQDVRVESALAAAVPALSDYELEVWKLDQQINARGVAVDVTALRNCRALVDGMTERLTTELVYLTSGRVESASQVAAVLKMLSEYGIHVPDLRAETVKETLENASHPVHAHPWAVRVLEIRAALASASVKKLGALDRALCADGRVRGLFMYGGAERTLRWAGRGAQPQNFPRGSAKVAKCAGCWKIQGQGAACFDCGKPLVDMKWNFDAAMQALESFQDQSVDSALARWGDDVLGVVAGTLRSLFVAAPGHRFVCSDYSAIEAVVLAALAGEEWRLEVFRTHGKIYEMSASKITGTPLEAYLEYKRVNGEHHPDRQAIGKVAELASGYGGGLGAWKAFGADDHMTEDEIKVNVERWRAESPAIVGFWYGLERAAISAIQSPHHYYSCRGIHYHYDGKVLRCMLPSGRSLVYHKPRVFDDRRVKVKGSKQTAWLSDTPAGADLEWTGRLTKRIKFWGWNSNPKYGPIGWHELETYGGRLAENVTQAVARDLLAHGMRHAAQAGYNIVLHVHDEIVCEQPDGHGSVEELERLMGTLPAWAEGWPVFARGGWDGKFYRKD